MLRHQDGEALGKAQATADDHPVQPIRGSHRCQGVNPYATAQHRGVDHGVKLLEHAAQHQRQGKA